MREIKFRGKVFGANTGHYELDYALGNLIKEIKTGKMFICDLGHLREKTNANEIFIEVIPNTVGQYTGLKDKNNKGICEGDIVLFDYIPYEVYQHECGDWRAGGKIIWEWIGDDATENEWEVIGNIYENKELLE